MPDKPKALADILGRPFLSYLLDILDNAGLKEVVLCTGHRGELVEQEFGDGYKNIAISYSREPEPLDTAGAIRYALPLLHSDPVIAMNGDSLCPTDLHAFIKWHIDCASPGTLLLTKVSDISRYGQVKIDEIGKVLSFEEKCAASGSGLISAGLYLLGREMIESIPTGKRVSIERDTFPGWIGHGLRGYAVNSEFIDIGTPESYSTAAEFVEKIWNNG